ncbi:YciI family protein (plasmid) [Gemmobacter fulvus]|uniref:YciI family protein n=1 Tax=Gemmobacter fulvus TaxID=2840474 RepID=A0A975S3N9_9RHOB|nr:YciI family protein [Gemmobacter fulvus]MBT9246222.1 YciI family protein [Gemmobacter fulvus]MDQ1850185.1 YciI family protein [Gemmobacter fulvus]QWK92420.1 YciI family protein [Gemmobacter fulvus]
MGHFVVYTRDAPGLAALRDATRPAHIAFMQSLGSAAIIGGPLLGPDGAEKLGGMYVLEADSLAAAEAIAARDPFVLAGLFATVHVDAWRWQTRNL